MGRFTKWSAAAAAVLICFLEVFGQPAQGAWRQNEGEERQEPNFSLHAQSAVLLDGDTGRILYGKNENELRPMASTTKIMTCILALEKGNLKETVRASAKAAAQPKVHLGVREGETFLLEDLLYSLMLESHNDTAVMIAEQISGTTEDFAREMNRKAAAIGCKNTYFITPNGLDASEKVDGEDKIHGTTAAELARIMAYCVNRSPKREEFLKITQTESYQFMDLEKKRSFRCVNHNALLSMMEEAISGKTGFTGEAGYTYVGAVESEGRSFIFALLGCGWPPNKTYKWSDARKLLDYGKREYQLKTLRQEPLTLKLPLTGGFCWEEEGEVTGQAELLLEELPRREFLMGGGEKVSVLRYLPKSLEAPVHKGEQVGRVEYRIGGWLVACSPVYAARDARKLTLSACIRRGLELFLKI